MDSDVLDEALDYLADRGPIFRGFLTNHGPMAAEALIRLEREREVMPFLAGYRLFLEDRPPLNGRVDPQRWQDMLGRRDQFAAWQQFFENELAEHPWPDVLDTWTYRLAPGLWGELLHGLIRTGHAARALGPSAVRLLAPHVSVGTTRSLVRYAWQAAAKINASWSFDRSLAPVDLLEFKVDDVIDQAVASGDEHAMKLVEACLREHALNPQPVYLAAASDVVIRLRN